MPLAQFLTASSELLKTSSGSQWPSQDSSRLLPECAVMFNDSSIHHNAQHLKVGILTGCAIFLETWNLCTIVNDLTAKPGATVSCSSAGMSADEYQHPSLPFTPLASNSICTDRWWSDQTRQWVFTQAMLLGNGGRLRLQGLLSRRNSEEKALYLGHHMS